VALPRESGTTHDNVGREPSRCSYHRSRTAVVISRNLASLALNDRWCISQFIRSLSLRYIGIGHGPWNTARGPSSLQAFKSRWVSPDWPNTNPLIMSDTPTTTTAYSVPSVRAYPKPRRIMEHAPSIHIILPSASRIRAHLRFRFSVGPERP
jgi:hypothetical protein